MAVTARNCAVDIGSVWVKAMATVSGGTRLVQFPTRLGLGTRVSGPRDKPPQVVTYGDAVVRVGDRSDRTGFVESELPKALSETHSSAVLIAAAYDRLGIAGSSVLMVGSSVAPSSDEAAYLRSSLSNCRLSNGSAVLVSKLGVMGSAEAVLADFSLDQFAGISPRGGKEEKGRFAVVDFGSKEWRLALVSDGAEDDEVEFRKADIETAMFVEKRTCEIIETRLNVSVNGVAEIFETGVCYAKRGKRDITMHIAQARREAWREFGPSLIAEIGRHGASTIYGAGGNATVLKEASSGIKDIDFKIAKQCEVSIVRGLLKSARRWGEQG